MNKSFLSKFKNLKSIIFICGYLLRVLGSILILPLLFSLIFNEGRTVFISFLIPSLLCLTLGFTIKLIYNTQSLKLDLVSSMLTVSFAWLISSLIGALPFKFALKKSFIDCFFESVSGFTTTGITVFKNLSSLPQSIILWRSMIQWLGGLGILTFFLLITFRSEGNLWRLFSAESHKINVSRPVPNIFKTIKIFWGIYIFYTILQIILLVIFQVSIFDALIHSFTTLSTGGFSNYDSSIGYFQQIGHPFYKQIEYITIIFMILGGMNFLVHFKILTGNLKEIYSSIEMKYFWSIIFSFTLIILIARYKIDETTLQLIENNIRTILFQIVSVMTTTGYVTENIGSTFFPVIAKQLFLLLMLIGGCVGSTAGGVKIMRIATLNHLFLREIKKISLPRHAVIPVTMDNNIIDTEEVLKISALFFGWIFLIIIGSGITSIFSDLNAFQSLSGMMSALGNIGPFYFSVEKMISLSPIIKVTYILGMLAGRLEIIPIFVLFSRSSWNR